MIEKHDSIGDGIGEHPDRALVFPGLLFHTVFIEPHLDGRMQLAFIEGFEYVPVRLADLCPFEGGLIGIGSQEYDRNFVKDTYPGGSIDTIHPAGKVDIHEDDIGAGSIERFKCRFTGSCNTGNNIPQFFQCLP